MTISSLLGGLLPTEARQVFNGIMGSHEHAKPSHEQFSGLLDGSPRHGPNALREDQPNESRVHLARMGLGVEIKAEERSYSLEVEIGNDAIAFNARPIVAPTATAQDNASQSLENVREMSQSRAEQVAASAGGPKDTTPPAPPPSQLGSLSSPSRTDQNLSTLNANSQIARTQNQPKVSIGLQTPSSDLASQAPAENRSSRLHSQPHSRAENIAKHRGIQTLQSIQTNSPVFAQILAKTGEYRLIIRGTQLSQEDNQRLQREVRTALISMGFPERPINISSNENEA